MWIIGDNPNHVRGKTYDRLVNITNGNRIFIDIFQGQDADDLNLQVWGNYTNQNDVRLFTGTEVECVRVIEQFAEKLNARRINPWETN